MNKTLQTQRIPATRQAALNMIASFEPYMGRRYTSGRNYDRGPGRHDAVSRLSPYVRRRLVTEEELVDAAVAQHGLEGAEKFVQEVFWRGYFKGWLERRPSVWSSYRADLVEDLAALETNAELRLRVEAAEAGATGLECFDAWSRELAETGYLHNHARMWYASIWIFTLKLPWRIGADFFLRHLLDGDPASNTLGWRWVAGLHTRGKAYQARAANIAKYTNQRFTPVGSDLASAIEALDATEPDGLPPVAPLRAVEAPVPGVPTALLITEEDCQPEVFAPEQLDLRAAATLSGSHLRSPRAVGEDVGRFEAEALADAAERLNMSMEILTAGDPATLAEWAQAAGATQIATAYVPEGPLRDWLRAAEPALGGAGVRLCEWRRHWDAAIWPYATAGFFKLKQQIPRILKTREAA